MALKFALCTSHLLHQSLKFCSRREEPGYLSSNFFNEAFDSMLNQTGNFKFEQGVSQGLDNTTVPTVLDYTHSGFAKTIKSQ